MAGGAEPEWDFELFFQNEEEITQNQFNFCFVYKSKEYIIQHVDNEAGGRNKLKLYLHWGPGAFWDTILVLPSDDSTGQRGPGYHTHT